MTSTYKPRVRLSIANNTPVKDVAKIWLKDIEYAEGPYRVYAAHWNRLFGTMKKMCAPKATAGYWRTRLGEVRHRTLSREAGPMRDFLNWCGERKLITFVPEITPPAGQTTQSESGNTSRASGQNIGNLD